MSTKYEKLYAMFASDQMDEATWMEHRRNDPELAKWDDKRLAEIKRREKEE